MRQLAYAAFLLALIGFAAQAEGHGFSLSVNYNANFTPLSLTASSQEPYLDQHDFAAGPNNLFLGASAAASSGRQWRVFSGDSWFRTNRGCLPSLHGYLQHRKSFVLLERHGRPASGAGHDRNLRRYVGPLGRQSRPEHEPPSRRCIRRFLYQWHRHDLFARASTAPFGVSLYDTHEMEKDLYIGSGATYGEYGFAFNVTVHFSDGVTLNTGPLVDVFAISDPNYFDFADNASIALQDSATQAIYNAANAAIYWPFRVVLQDAATHPINTIVTAVPEPSSVILLRWVPAYWPATAGGGAA